MITVKDIAAAYATEKGISKVEAKERISDVLARVSDAITEDEKVFLSGFGTFKTTTKPARTMTSNLTGDTVEVPAKVVVKFKAANGLSDTVNS